MNPTNPYDTIQQLREQVAAQAAVIESLKSALKMSCWYVVFFHDMTEETNSKTKSAEAIAALNEALAIPTDSTQILDEARRAERERCAKVCESIYTNGDGAEGWIEIAANRIRAME